VHVVDSTGGGGIVSTVLFTGVSDRPIVVMCAAVYLHKCKIVQNSAIKTGYGTICSVRRTDDQQFIA